MREQIQLSLTIGFLIAIFASAGPAKAQSTDTVVAAHYPPLMIDGDDARPGLAIEALQEAARRADRQINIEFVPFERAQYELLTQTGTIMPALFQGKANDDDFLWVAELGQARLRFATLDGPVNTYDAARALGVIVVETGTTADATLTDLGFANVVRVHAPGASAQMLASGRADAWLLSDRLIAKTWADLSFSDPLVFGNIVREIPISLVANRDLPPEVTATYRAAYQEMQDDGTMDQLRERYDFVPLEP